jgi:hypothetical protein
VSGVGVVLVVGCGVGQEERIGQKGTANSSKSLNDYFLHRNTYTGFRGIKKFTLLKITKWISLLDVFHLFALLS